jgi:virulence-associated protein VagC
VEILRRGDEVILRPVAVGGGAVFDALAALPGDVWPEVRVDEAPQDREFD